MEILELELKNFRSHRHTILDLSGISTASICGENGAGKSSILYALTFVFWGTIGDTTESKINLVDMVAKNAKDCFVRVDVLADTKNESGERERYRIKREIQVSYGKKITAASKVTLSTVNPSGTAISCSDNSAKAINKTIKELLGGMSYKTATYSNFALQGEADKFMQAQAASRRALFESIINVDVYDQLKEKAKNRAKTAKAALATLATNDAEEEQLLAEMSLLRERQTTLDGQQKEINDIIETLIHNINEMEKVIGDGGKSIEENINKLKVELLENQNKIATEKRNRQQAQDIIAKKLEIEQNRQALLDSRKTLEQLAAAKADYLSLTSRKSVLENNIKTLEEAIQNGERTIRVLQQKRAAFENNIRVKFGIAETKDTESALAEYKYGLNVQLSEVKAALLDGDKEKEGITTAIKASLQEEASLKAEIGSLGLQIKKINSAGAMCPIFNSECSRLKQENKELQVTTISETIKEIETRRALVATEQARKESALKDVTDRAVVLNEKITILQKQINEVDFTIQQFPDTITEIENGCSEAQKHVSNKNAEIIDIKKDIAEINNALRVLNFDIEQHGKEETKYEALCRGNWEKQYQTLLVAEESLRQINEKVVLLESHGQNTAKEIEQLKSGLEKKKLEIESLEPQLAKQRLLLTTKKEERQQNIRETSTIATRIGTVENGINVLRKTKKRAEAEREKLKTFETLSQVYDMAKTLITDNAIPRFQEAANSILEYLGVDVRIEVNTIEEVFDKTTRTNKTNKIFEIIVIDGEGDRREYATWSGGEKHRINLALRQALSMTLLNRAGSKIDLIVIDEGDTKLDAPGKLALVQMIEAANSGHISGYPAKVLFITHSEDLKDSFAQRITVFKGKNGSVVKVD